MRVEGVALTAPNQGLGGVEEKAAWWPFPVKDVEDLD
jgi:hypothetical protein